MKLSIQLAHCLGLRDRFNLNRTLFILHKNIVDPRVGLTENRGLVPLVLTLKFVGRDMSTVADTTHEASSRLYTGLWLAYGR